MKFATAAAARPAKPGRPAVRQVELMAMDRSMRSYCEDGRLRVQATNISKAAVNGYLGRTIPDWERLGLDPDRVYMLLRDPAELARAAPTFNNLPLLDRHALATAADHKPDLVVGSTGSDCQFVSPYLQVSLVCWAADSIARINDGTQRQLSSAYRYQAIPEPGVYQGTRYDLRMADIRGSHVALVEEGRAGPDVVVGDAALKLKGKFMPARPPGVARDDETELDDGVVSQLKAYLQAVLTPDAMADVEKILAGQSVPNPEMAGDAAARQVARRFVADQRAREDAAFLQRFPDAARLRG